MGEIFCSLKKLAGENEDIKAFLNDFRFVVEDDDGAEFVLNVEDADKACGYRDKITLAVVEHLNHVFKAENINLRAELVINPDGLDSLRIKRV